MVSQVACLSIITPNSLTEFLPLILALLKNLGGPGEDCPYFLLYGTYLVLSVFRDNLWVQNQSFRWLISAFIFLNNSLLLLYKYKGCYEKNILFQIFLNSYKFLVPILKLLIRPSTLIIRIICKKLFSIFAWFFLSFPGFLYFLSTLLFVVRLSEKLTHYCS